MTILKKHFKAAARFCGLEIKRFLPATSHAAQLKAMLLWHKVNLVLDVGANIGQYGEELRNHVDYRGRIISFEPMRHAHEALNKAAARDDLWEIAERTAIGAEKSTVTINISSNSVSSSVLPMLDAHLCAAPESRYSDTEQVPLIPLDLIAPKYIEDNSVVFLKIDTQGYEGEVLKGARETLQKVVGVQMELSLVPLYGQQQLMPELLQRMSDMGFELWGISPTFAEPSTGRMLQVDATFFRR